MLPNPDNYVKSLQLEKYEIQMEDVYDMDETGFLIGTIQNVHVIVNKTVHMKYQAQPGWQE